MACALVGGWATTAPAATPAVISRLTTTRLAVRRNLVMSGLTFVGGAGGWGPRGGGGRGGPAGSLPAPPLTTHARGADNSPPSPRPAAGPAVLAPAAVAAARPRLPPDAD